MQIHVECPECSSDYHLQSENIGKKMRCTNPTCQSIFEIREVETDVPSPPPPVQVPTSRNAGARAESGYQTGNVGDLIPVLEAEIIPDAMDVTDDDDLIRNLDLDVPTVEAKKKQPKERDWRDDSTAPPTAKKSKKPEPVVVVDEDEDDEPRRGYHDDDDEDDEDPVASRVSARTRRKKRRGMIAFVMLTATVLGVGGYAVVLLIDYFTKTEQKAFADAKALYQEHKYPEAETQFIALIKKFPESKDLAEYSFLQKMSNLRKSVYSVVNASEPKPSMELILLFDTEHADDELLKPDRYAFDFYETIQKEIEDVVSFADKQSQAKKYDSSDAALADVETLLPFLAKFQPEGVNPPAFATDTERIALVNSGARKRLLALAEMRKLAADPTDENLDKIREIIRIFNLDKDGEAIIIWDMARKNAQLLVRYFADKPPVPASAAPEGNLPGLLLVPIIERGPTIPAGTAAPAATNSVFFALARGVLYALDEWDGRVLWATRVGIDVDTLPLRVPASDLNPELVLIPFNDGKQFGLSARLARTGQMLWHQPFDTPILGRPVLVGQRAFVPTRDEKGTISVLEITNGSRLGRIQTNHRLGVGGAKQPDKGILFFPADSAQVFVFDVDKHDEAGLRLDPFCLGVVSTGHPSRSLRCPALVIGDDQQNMRPSLLLMQADGLDGMLLRSYTLPPDGAAIPWPVIVPIDVRLNGWTWFEPFSDGEKLAMVTERGEFGLYGIHQPGNQDPPLFPLPAKSFRIDGTGLIEIRDNDPNVTPSLQSRGQVVYANENRYWVIAAGYLHQLDLGLTALEGPKLVQSRRPTPIGTPLHEGQVNPRRDIAVMVTQSTTGSACVATAIDLYTGNVRWARQLGAIVQSESMPLADGTVTLDQAGGLFWFPKFTKPIPPEVEWQTDEYWQVSAPVRDVATPPTLLRSKDGNTVYAVITTGSGKQAKLLLRSFTPGQPIETKTLLLPSPLAGPPILVGSSIILPLRDGNLHRLKLVDGKVLEPGPTWRGDRISESSTCHLTPMNDTDFLSTNGDRTVVVRRWSSDEMQFETLWQMSLLEKIARRPLILPSKDEPLRVVLADVKGAVLLYEGAKLERLAKAWRPIGANGVPAGTITSGPYLKVVENQSRIGYVVNGKQFVWIDPENDRFDWVYAAKGLIGEPLVVGSQLWLTAGDKLVSVNPMNGEVVRTEPLPTGMVPTAAVVPITTVEGPRLLVPLTDGTQAMVPLNRGK